MPSLAILALLGAPASAQDGFDAHAFAPAPLTDDARSPLAVERPSAFSQGDFWLGILGEYAESPLVEVIAAEPGAPGEERRLLDNLVALDLSTGVALHQRVRIDAALPVYVSSQTQPEPGAYGLTNPAAVGDARLSLMIEPVRPLGVVGGGGFGLGIVGHVDLPTGDPALFLGEPGIAGGFRLAATGELGPGTLGADVGAQFNRSVASLGNLTGSDAALLGASAGILASPYVGLNAEIVARPAFAPGSVPGSEMPIETMLSVKYANPIGGFLVAGGAAGITDAVGVPAFRVFVGGGYGHAKPPHPLDFDPLGALASRDACPTEPETPNGWRDDDGCPDQLGALVFDIRYNGQPWAATAEITGPDGTHTEAIGDKGKSIDAVPGSAWSVKASDGCLVGAADAVVKEAGTQLRVDLQPHLDAHVEIDAVGPDGSPLPTATATWRSAHPACVPPLAATAGPNGHFSQAVGSGATHTVTVTAPGYTSVDEAVTLAPGEVHPLRVELRPTLIKLEATQITILEKVQFETGRATIRPESHGLLDEVAATILSHPEIGHVEIAGHTDNVGSDTANLRLSQDRAESVRQYLIGKGVPSERLTATGYGESVPISTNRTPEGREQNRRVEFLLRGEGPPGTPGSNLTDHKAGGTP